MRDEDFDDIGKRLYDMEAEPPSDGWRKIAPVIVPPSGGKSNWFKKFWWTPFFIVVPATIYYWSETSINKVGSASVVNIADSLTQTKESNITAASLFPSEEIDLKEESIVTKGEKSYSVEKLQINSVSEIEVGEDDKPSRPVVAASHLERNKKSRSTAILTTNSINASQTRNQSIEVNQNNLDKNFESGNAQTFEVKDSVSVGQGLKIAERVVRKTKPYASIGTDSLIDKTEKMDSVASIEASDEETDIVKESNEKKINLWRFSIAYTPQYVSRNVRPTISDEVYVTQVDNSRSHEKIGQSISIGMGKTIMRNLYIDAHLSYTAIDQDVYYSFSNGIVDTLITIQQAENTYLVKPIYQEQMGQASTKLRYGGIKLSATYYFLASRLGRFNVSLAGSGLYAIKSGIREKVDGQWVSASNADLSKTNLSFMISGGYNVNLRNSWELMINPGLIYYANDVKSKSLPYSFNQKSFGLMFMLSKTITPKS